MVVDSTRTSAQWVIHAMPDGDKSYLNTQAWLYLTDTYKIWKLKEKWNFERAKN